MRSRRMPLTAAALSLLLVAGCSAGGADGAGGEAGGSTADYAMEEPAGEADRDDSGTAAADGDRATTQLFVTTGGAEVSVPDPRVAAAQVATYVERLDGHVQERVESGSVDDGDAQAYLVLRVPSDRMTEMLAALDELGEVMSSSSNSVEVTGQAQDLDARIRALEVSVGRLERLLAAADTTADLVAAEQALTDRQEQLESLQAQSARLADQVALATLEIRLWTPEQVPEEAPTGFWGGLMTGWDSLVTTIGGLLLALGVLLPWLAALGLVGLVVLAVLRARRRPAGRDARATPTGPDAVTPAGEAQGDLR